MKKVVYYTNKFSLVKLTDSDGRNMFNILFKKYKSFLIYSKYPISVESLVVTRKE